MVELGSIWLFVVPFALAAALPGPAQGALIAQVLSRGGASTLPFVSGMVAGNAVWLLAAIFGLSALAMRFETAFIAVKWLGIAYLLFIAWNLWTADGAAKEAPSSGSGSRGLLAGALLTLGNPKAVVFFGAVLPHAFDLTTLSLPEAMMILGLGLAVDFTVQGIYLLAATQARAFIRSPRSMKLVNRSSAGLMAGSAALIASRG
ncbi:LysE family translocator [Microvirga sp. BSC39]|jgi:threonine/homoserine/homoserine lactone efflux protein|uniref:LysE family translocator n=1 Tax=Microvirga sp. BSC39 TaxID=1549810 RepID=UPI0004E9352F|nr:LysE family translocator [Microvirga sp. BSC39]KFG70651.1 amino acid efflux transmembrane protein [Microvirga sp. BSC39]